MKKLLYTILVFNLIQAADKSITKTAKELAYEVSDSEIDKLYEEIVAICGDKSNFLFNWIHQISGDDNKKFLELMRERLDLIKEGKLNLEQFELEVMKSKLLSSKRPTAGCNIARTMVQLED